MMRVFRPVAVYIRLEAHMLYVLVFLAGVCCGAAPCVLLVEIMRRRTIRHLERSILQPLHRGFLDPL